MCAVKDLTGNNDQMNRTVSFNSHKESCMGEMILDFFCAILSYGIILL